MSHDMNQRICLIGAGPAGCAVLFNLAKRKREGEATPDVVCFEKQSDWGGMWNYTWRTGFDEFGEPVHASMYKLLFMNSPKEATEFPDYSFRDHFGQDVPSFLNRPLMLDYLTGRWKREEFRQWIKFHHAVKSVVYDQDEKNFVIIVKDLVNDCLLPPQRFSHVIVGSGHFSMPHIPYLDGIESFPGRVIHSHDFKDAAHYAGKRVLVIGTGPSGEDIALQCYKFGAKKVFISWRSFPLEVKWPKEVEEHPLVTGINGNTISFKDGVESEFDEIILCTGYLHHYPFMADDLRLKLNGNRFWIPNLYNGVLFLGGGDQKVFYLGTQNMIYTISYVEQESIWTLDVIFGRRSLPSMEEMQRNELEWREDERACQGIMELFAFQTKHIKHLAKENGYHHPVDVSLMFENFVKARKEDMTTFRDQPQVSLITGEVAPPPKLPFMKIFDESFESLV